MNHTVSNTSSGRQMIAGNLLALSAAICWGFNEPANKVLIPENISASGVALFRIIAVR